MKHFFNFLSVVILGSFLISCQTIDKKANKAISVEEAKLSKWLNQSVSELKIELVNIGENDLDEDDDMMVRVKIPDFSYDQWHNYTEDIDSGDVETITINVDIPSTATTGDHEVKIYTRHDGNSNSNSFSSDFYTI